jgi:hypothetical protein
MHCSHVLSPPQLPAHVLVLALRAVPSVLSVGAAVTATGAAAGAVLLPGTAVVAVEPATVGARVAPLGSLPTVHLQVVFVLVVYACSSSSTSGVSTASVI